MHDALADHRQGKGWKGEVEQVGTQASLPQKSTCWDAGPPYRYLGTGVIRVQCPRVQRTQVMHTSIWAVCCLTGHRSYFGPLALRSKELASSSLWLAKKFSPMTSQAPSDVSRCLAHAVVWKKCKPWMRIASISDTASSVLNCLESVWHISAIYNSVSH